MDQPKKDGDVLVPGPSRIFERGGDAVAYASFKHQQEAARMAREAAAFQCRQLQQKKSEAKAVQALKIRKSLGGTLRMTPKPAVPASIFNVPGTAPMPEGRGSRQQYRGGMRAEEAEKLMKSKSKHSAEARSNKHRVRKAPTKKRFFLCGNISCTGETAVLGLTAPREACDRCGEMLWWARGKGNKTAAGCGGKGGGVGKLILSISESNRNADVSTLYD
eukprot:evm.model.NODE_26981_length_61533_cov_35.017178.13